MSESKCELNGDDKLSLYDDQCVDITRHYDESNTPLNDCNLNEEQQIEYEAFSDWKSQLTIRALIAGVLIGTGLAFVMMRIMVSNAGITPNLGISASLIGFGCMHVICKFVLPRCLKSTNMFTVQENVVIQTTAVAVIDCSQMMAYGTALGAMSSNVAVASAGYNYTFYVANKDAILNQNFTLPNTTPIGPYFDPSFWQLFVTGLIFGFNSIQIASVTKNLFVTRMPELTWPSATATGVMLNQFHSNAAESMKSFYKFCTVGLVFFLYNGFNFLWTTVTDVATGAQCSALGFMPIFGEFSYKMSTWLDLHDLTFTGAAMLMSRNVNFSTILGQIVYWCILYPFISSKGMNLGEDFAGDLPEGVWFNKATTNMTYTYVILCLCAGIIGSTPFVLINIADKIIQNNKELKEAERKSESDDNDDDEVVYSSSSSQDGKSWKQTIIDSFKFNSKQYVFQPRKDKCHEEEFLNYLFMSQNAPIGVSVLVFVLSMVIGIAVVPLYISVSWWMILFAGVVAVPLALCCTYVTGLCDQNVCQVMGKAIMVAIGQLAAKADPENAILYSLSWLLVIIIIAVASCDLTSDYVVAQKTKTAPNAMFIGQFLGMSIGTLIVPGIWEMFSSAFPDYGFSSSINAPMAYGSGYRVLAKIGVDGFSNMPPHAETIFFIVMGVTFAVDALKFILVKLITRKNPDSFGLKLIGDWWPNTMMMSLCAYAFGPSYWSSWSVGWIAKEIYDFKINRCKTEKGKEELNMSRTIVASGIIIGCGVWNIVGTFLAMGKINGGPLCADFSQLNSVSYATQEGWNNWWFFQP